MTTDLKAVYPPRGSIVHLYLPGYRSGAKQRSLPESGMCGAIINEETPPPVGPIPTGRTHLPLDVALELEPPTPAADDPRPPRFWRWCGICIGRAIDRYDLTDLALAAILAADERRHQPLPADVPTTEEKEAHG